jgi:hypothetical protein
VDTKKFIDYSEADDSNGLILTWLQTEILSFANRMVSDSWFLKKNYMKKGAPLIVATPVLSKLPKKYKVESISHQSSYLPFVIINKSSIRK